MRKIKKASKGKKSVRGQKKIKAKKGKKATKASKKSKTIKRLKVSKEKVLGKIDHFFDKISVATVELKAPIKVGDIIHIKGHTTDFVQKIDSMQIEHEDVEKASRGEGIGFKVREKVRSGDTVYLAADQKSIPVVATPTINRSILPKKEKPIQFKPMTIQSTMFANLQPKPQPSQSSAPIIAPKIVAPPTPQFKPQPSVTPQLPKVEPKKKNDPYGNTKFLNF
ncbi:MAG: hypothetical protein WC890_07220 [Candidatus Margulisiibacteriota bacterium]